MKKKILTILVLLASLLSSCEPQGASSDEAQSVADSNFREVTYKNHQYIIFMTSFGGYQGYGGLEHDPDCQNPSHKIKKGEEQIYGIEKNN